MKIGRRNRPFTAPERFPQLTELQVGMLRAIARQKTFTDMRYKRILDEHVLILPQGVPVGPEGRRAALALGQSIVGLQRLVALTPLLWLTDLPTELSPAAPLAVLQLAAYTCAAIAAPDCLPETILSVDERHRVSDLYGHEWFRTVNGFREVSEDRLVVLLSQATAKLAADR
jgi:hypothetical protein